MRQLTHFFIWVTKKWWVVIFVFLLNFASFRILFGLEHRFTNLTGLKVFDTQNDLTAQRLLEQLPAYVGETRRAYTAFAAFDYVFPIVAALFLVMVWTLLLRVNTTRLAKRLLNCNVSLLPLVVTLFDWLENISIAGVLATTASPNSIFVNAVILFKRLKLAGLFTTGFLSVVLLLFTVGSFVMTRRRS
jgi:hypothetical protein